MFTTLFVGVAVAAPPPRTVPAPQGLAVRAELNAPGGCPSADAFLEEILKRSPSARAASAAEAARRYRANVEKAGARFRGTVESESLSRTDGKVVEAASCSEVVTALAIVIALSLDADDIAPSDGESADSSKADPQAQATPRLPPAPAKKAPNPTSKSGWEWGLAVEGALLSQALPVLFGGSASAFVRTAQSGALAPSLRLGGGMLLPADSSEPVELRMPFLLLDVCPSRFAAGPVHALPCLHTTAGLLSGAARAPGATQAASLPFVATGPEVRLELQLNRVLLGVRGALLGVWSAPVFRSQPSRRVLKESGTMAIEGGAGVGLVF